MPHIHPTAIVDPGAMIADDAYIGPYCTVSARAEIGSGTRLISHVIVDGLTKIGHDCTIFPFASIGMQTQDLKFKGGTPGVRVGHHTTVRESATIHAATYDGDFTTVGDHCHIMAYAHVAHDCHVGNRVIMANAATLAGHVIVEDQAVIGGLSGVHQFVRVGRLSITGGCSKVVKDVPPFMMADGNPLAVHTVNKIGMERAGISESTRNDMREAFKIIYRNNLLAAQAIEALRGLSETPEMKQLISFLESSTRGITR